MHTYMATLLRRGPTFKVTVQQPWLGMPGMPLCGTARGAACVTLMCKHRLPLY